MLSKIKGFLSRLWQKTKPYVGYIAAFLAGLVCLILLGKKTRYVSSYEDLKANQEKRKKEAAKVTENAEKVKENTDQLIEDYYKRKNERRK